MLITGVSIEQSVEMVDLGLLLLPILGEAVVAFQRCCIATVFVLLVMMILHSEVFCGLPVVFRHPWFSVHSVTLDPVE